MVERTLMRTISADIILALYLEDKEKVSMRELNQVRSLIEKSEPEISVDITKEALISAVNTYDGLFGFSDSEIFRKRPLEKSEVGYFAIQLYSWAYSSVIKAIAQVKAESVMPDPKFELRRAEIKLIGDIGGQERVFSTVLDESTHAFLKVAQVCTSGTAKLYRDSDPRPWKIERTGERSIRFTFTWEDIEEQKTFSKAVSEASLSGSIHVATVSHKENL